MPRRREKRRNDPTPEALVEVEREPTRPTSRAEAPLSPQAEELYHALIRARMKEHACGRCGESLEGASIASVDDGATFDDLGLSDESAVLALAATEHLSVRCARCGFEGDIGTSLLRLPSPIGVERQAPWDPHAIDLYRSLVGARLKEQVCTGCGSSLESSVVARATGGVSLSAHDLGDVAAARLLATTQRLSVCCAQCGAEVEI